MESRPLPFVVPLAATLVVAMLLALLLASVANRLLGV
jgi:hypothetical protein